MYAEEKISGCMHADSFHKKRILFNSLLLAYVGPVEYIYIWLCAGVAQYNIFILYFQVCIRTLFLYKEYVFILYAYFFHESTYSYLLLGSTYSYFYKK